MTKRFWTFLLLLVCVTSVANAASWYEPPGGAANQINDTDRVLIEQNGVSRVATRYQFYTGVKNGDAVSKDTFKNYTGIHRAALDYANTFTKTQTMPDLITQRDVRYFASIQDAIDYVAANGGGVLKDTRTTAYSGTGWRVKAGVHFYAAPVSYTVTSSIIVEGSAGLHGTSSSNNNGTKFIAANGLNADVVRSDTVLGNTISLVRSSNVVTVTTVAAHGLTTGDKVTIINPADTSFEGSSTGVTATVTGTTTFTYSNTGSDASSGSGWIVKPDTVGWQWGVVENFRVNGNSSGNTYGTAVHTSFPCENAHVRHITASDGTQGGVLISLAVAGSGDITDLAVMGNQGPGVNLHFYENSAKIGLISGDGNTGPLLKVVGGNTTSVTVGFIKSEVQTDVGGTKQDPVILLDRRYGASSTPSFSLLGGYAYGPPSTPKNDIIQISSASTWRVTTSNVMANFYTNAINDLYRSVTVPLSYLDRKPMLVYSNAGPGLYAAGGTNIAISNSSALQQTDASGTEKSIITADTSNNTYIKPIGGNLYLQDSASTTYISFASNTVNFFKSLYGSVSAYFAQFISTSANPADLGTVRLAKGDSVRFRNNANTGNVTALSLSSTDVVQLPAATSIGTSTFSALGTALSAGTMKYCTDCTTAATCAGSGTGHMAVSNGTNWTCQ